LPHEFDGDPFAWTAVIGGIIPSALRNKVELAPIPVVEPFGPKYFKLLPYAFIMVGAIEIEQDPCVVGKMVAPPLECLLYTATDERENG
jgi:hypothetical protein